MNTITVYRVAHKDDVTRGPWWGFVDIDWHGPSGKLQIALDDYVNVDSHPSPEDDGIMVINGIFAALSMISLKSWFGNGNIPDCLLDADFTVYKIIVEEKSCIMGHSGSQCMFNPNSMIDIKDIGILALVD